jgi:hypothetical protein
MPNNDRSICIMKIDQARLAYDKIVTYLSDIDTILSNDEATFQRKHHELRDEIAMCAEIATQVDKALLIVRSRF